MTRTAAIVLLMVLAGCGQRGPLFLPGTPPAVEPVPAPAAGEPEPGGDDDDDDEADER